MKNINYSIKWRFESLFFRRWSDTVHNRINSDAVEKVNYRSSHRSKRIVNAVTVPISWDSRKIS